MNVPAQLQKIFVALNQLCLVAPLKQVPARSMPKIVEYRVSGFQTLHKPAQVHGWRLQKEVDVVVHETEQVQPDTVDFYAFGQPQEKPLTITVVPKDILPAVPANRHVVDCAWKLNSDMSWHAGNLHLPCPICKP